MQRCPPPRNFTPAGIVRRVEFSLVPPPFIAYAKPSGAQAAGLRYERKVQEKFSNLYEGEYVRSPWFHFLSKGWKWCQPDGLFIDILSGKIIIVEIKLRHTSNAWWQTRRLYEPVIQGIFPTSSWTYSILEVVHWYDPDTAFPEHFTFASTPFDVPDSGFGVHILR